MTDPKSVATRYLDAWNEVDADRRARLLREHWVDDARYVDPLMRGDGLQQIDALIAVVHARFPGFRFALADGADGHGDHVRFSWSPWPSAPPASAKRKPGKRACTAAISASICWTPSPRISGST